MTQKGTVDVEFTKEEQKDEQRENQSREKSLLGELAESEVVNESEMVKESESDKPESDDPKPDEEEEEGKVEDEEDNQDDDTSDEEQEEEEEELEDVIPKSKYEKTLEKLQKRIDNVVAENKVLKERQEASAKKSDDPDLAKMENMSEKELESLIDQVEDAKFDAMRSEDRDQYKRLVEVGKKAQKVMRDAPQRYAQRQQESIQKAVSQIENDEAIGDFKEAAPKIKEIAEKIFSEFPQNLRTTPEAQGTAYALAAEHYKELKSVKPSGKKSDSDRHKRQVNSLKKKTSLDGKTNKGDVKKTNLRKLKAKAKEGDEHDKLGYFVNSGIIDEAKLFGKK